MENGNAYALAGPAELIFSNAVLISYYQVTNSAIFTQYIANDPVGVSIASNKTMRLFGVTAPVNASFSRPGSSFVSFTLEPNRPAEFTGPGTLMLMPTISEKFPPPHGTDNPIVSGSLLLCGVTIMVALLLTLYGLSRSKTSANGVDG